MRRNISLLLAVLGLENIGLLVAVPGLEHIGPLTLGIKGWLYSEAPKCILEDMIQTSFRGFFAL